MIDVYGRSSSGKVLKPSVDLDQVLVRATKLRDQMIAMQDFESAQTLRDLHRWALYLEQKARTRKK